MTKKERAMDARILLQRARTILLDKKGTDDLALDVSRLSSITDYFLIVSGTSGPHLKGMAEELEKKLGDEGAGCRRRAGIPESGWLVLDYSDVVVHLFSREMREYYAIEKLWSDAPVVAG